MTANPVIRIEQAGLGPDARVRLVLSGVPEPERLHRSWASSGSTIERVGDRMRATTTVEALLRAVGRTMGAAAAEDISARLRSAVQAWAGPAPATRMSGGHLPTDQRPLVMGVLNVTPDSFSDGGAVYPGDHPDAALARGRALLAEGADILDVGGESTRPGAAPVPAEEELARVLPVLRGLADGGVPLSIDTSKAAVAEAAVAAGASIVNDVSGGADEALLRTVADTGAAYVLMHTRGTPQDMAARAEYADVMAEVYEFLAAGIERCLAAGIEEGRLLVDPGLGFAKRPVHNLVLLQNLRQLRSLGRPVVIGASRKSFLGTLLGSDVDDRLEGSLACAVAAVLAGASVVRAHEVRATWRAVRVSHAIATGGAAEGSA